MLFVIARHFVLGWLVGEAVAIDIASTRSYSQIGRSRG